ncbi:MAG TPA: Holliday junction resolvase RuvX [Anaerolineae bacterium]|nr:Holliday junction resolvase RuvX [Anaerolineae bacterium]
MTRILALDWGEKRIGVAFSEGILASPRGVIKRKSKAEDYARIAALVAETGAELLVIGLPTTFDPDNPIGPQAKRVLKHSKALKKHLDIPIEMADERYSTVDAGEYLRQSGKKGKIPIDAAAAAVILQTYLDEKPL